MNEKKVRTILREQWSASEHQTCGELIERIRSSADTQIVPVIDEAGAPVGVVETATALNAVSNPLHYSVCERRNLRMLMSEEFVFVDVNETISQVSNRIITSGQGLSSGGFVITEGGKYVGIGLNTDLLYFLVESNEQKAIELAEINDEIVDSVRYASRIQQGMLPSLHKLRQSVRSVGLIWEPRDIVGGDVFWTHASEDGQRVWFALVDCTGHGVPGALMSMLVITSLNRVFSQNPDIGPAKALAEVADLVRAALQQDKPGCESNDGFDAGMIMLDKSQDKLVFCGARTNGYIIPRSDQSVMRLVADRAVLGYPGNEPHGMMEEFEVPLHDCSTFVMASDGIFDQPGEAFRRAFGPRRFLEALETHRILDAQALTLKLSDVIARWRGTEVRRDDLSALALTF